MLLIFNIALKFPSEWEVKSRDEVFMDPVKILDSSLDELDLANKYLFVKDYKKAQEILKRVSSVHALSFDILMKRVEIAGKSNGLKEIVDEYDELQKSSSSCAELEQALLFAKIKDFENQKDTDRKLMSKSEFSMEDFGSGELVSDLDLDVSQGNISFDGFEKSPHRLDDELISIHQPVYVSNTIDPSFSVKNQKYASQDPIISRALMLPVLNPDSFATWLIAGYACEAVGDYEQAAEKWKMSYSLKKDSVFCLEGLANLQKSGLLISEEVNYTAELEKLNGSYSYGIIENHVQVYSDFLFIGETHNAIKALKVYVDWVYEENGDVSPEVEVLFLAAAMAAHHTEKNFDDADEYRLKIEKIITALCRDKGNTDLLIFIAQICEEYELNTYAQMCYYTALLQEKTSTSQLVKISAHCISRYDSSTLSNALKIAYQNSQGSIEIKFYLLMSLLKNNHVNIIRYMKLKNEVRSYISKNNILTGREKINEVLDLFTEDPEIYHYSAELYLREKNFERAMEHYEKSISLDQFNVQGMYRSALLCLQLNEYYDAKKYSIKALKMTRTDRRMMQEFNWIIGFALFSEGENLRARDSILKSIQSNPWNISYLNLLLRIQCRLSLEYIGNETSELIDELESLSLVQSIEKLSDEKYERICTSINRLLKGNSWDLAWTLCKICVVLRKELPEDFLETMGRAASVYSLGSAAEEIIILLEKNQNIFHVETARIYFVLSFLNFYQNRLESAKDWLYILHRKQELSDRDHNLVYELESIIDLLLGKNFERTQALLESIIEFRKNTGLDFWKQEVILGYCMVQRGDMKAGLSMTLGNLSTDADLLLLFLLVKALMRSGLEMKLYKEIVSKIQTYKPLFPIEHWALEELYQVIGFNFGFSPSGLSC